MSDDMDPEIATIGAGLRLSQAAKLRVAAYLLSAAGQSDLANLVHERHWLLPYDKTQPWRELAGLRRFGDRLFGLGGRR